MKNLLILLLVACSLSLFSQNYNVVLRDTVMFPGQGLANIWGFKKGGKEYALVGATKGLVIVDVTDPANCFRVGNQLTDYINSSWREVRTLGNYTYITSEGTTPSGTPTPPGVGTGGLGIVDLSGLPATPPTTVTKYYGDGIILNLLHRVHALHVDTIRSMLYLYGASGVSCSGALRLDISNPLSPVFQDKYCDYYIHDGYVHKDTLFGGLINAGKMAVIKFEYNPLTGIDTIPYWIGDVTTPNAFTHNAWLSTNRQYAFTTDEKPNSYLTAYDVSDRTNLVEKDKIRTGTSNSIVHNTYIKGNHAVSSWYEDGVTITDISRPTNLIQTGRYDTYATPPFPLSTGTHYDGAWGVYPYLPSGNLLVSNITENKVAANVDTGVLYILTPTYVSACYLEGEVKDASTNLALSGVTVAIQYTDPLNSGATGTTGAYATGQPTAGTYSVTFSKSGYVTQTLSVTLTNGDVTQPAIVYLAPIGFPLELISFSANAEGPVNLLDWATASESKTDRFEILVRRNDSEHWGLLGVVDAAGESLDERKYRFMDEAPGAQSYYRLRTVDYDGQEYFSEIVEVNRQNSPFTIGNIYPVPTTGILQLTISSDRQIIGDLTIGNMTGEILLQQSVDLVPGENKKDFYLPDSWADGQYWIRIANGHLESKGTFLLLR